MPRVTALRHLFVLLLGALVGFLSLVVMAHLSVTSMPAAIDALFAGHDAATVIQIWWVAATATPVALFTTAAALVVLRKASETVSHRVAYSFGFLLPLAFMTYSAAYASNPTSALSAANLSNLAAALLGPSVAQFLVSASPLLGLSIALLLSRRSRPPTVGVA